MTLLWFPVRLVNIHEPPVRGICPSWPSVFSHFVTLIYSTTHSYAGQHTFHDNLLGCPAVTCGVARLPQDIQDRRELHDSDLWMQHSCSVQVLPGSAATHGPELLIIQFLLQGYHAGWVTHPGSIVNNTPWQIIKLELITQILDYA